MGEGTGRRRAEALRRRHAGRVQAEGVAGEIRRGQSHRTFLLEQARAEADGGQGRARHRDRHRGVQREPAADRVGVVGGTGAVRPRPPVRRGAGAPADPVGPAVPEGLGTLLGTPRARVLVLFYSPLSTSRLVALTGQELGSVGRRLRVAGRAAGGAAAGGAIGAVRADGGGGGTGRRTAGGERRPGRGRGAEGNRGLGTRSVTGRELASEA